MMKVWDKEQEEVFVEGGFAVDIAILVAWLGEKTGRKGMLQWDIGLKMRGIRRKLEQIKGTHMADESDSMDSEEASEEEDSEEEVEEESEAANNRGRKRMSAMSRKRMSAMSRKTFKSRKSVASRNSGRSIASSKSKHSFF